MKLGIAAWKNMLLAAAELLKANAGALSKLDSEIGDGDHGVTIGKIALQIESDVRQWPDGKFLKAFLSELGTHIMGVNGGSAGPLWGNLFEGFSCGLTEEETEIDEAGFKRIVEAGLSAMQEISTAKVGDKTMMDVLIPVATVIRESAAPLPELLALAANAARTGADHTADYIAKYGRAKNLKEKSLGHKDPGAVSLALLFIGMASAVSGK